ncbi:hypothetical protein [Enterocloster sp.]|uniref:hypothetical protein n=1 Tax=Enterocloster sp. TaxID=2719315 RepID=UPI0039A0F447
MALTPNSMSAVLIINVQASVLAAHASSTCACCQPTTKIILCRQLRKEEDVGHVVTTTAITLVLNQYARSHQDTRSTDDLLLAAPASSQPDVKLFGRLRYFEQRT